MKIDHLFQKKKLKQWERIYIPRSGLALMSAAGGVAIASATGADPSIVTPDPSPETPLQRPN